ncbi:MAG TPA: hypothetical protein VD928_01260 [Candidatus Paceibacterota bacterium]|nr:hypothetical protein [Candidatus Paceibacterota bacterium]
MQRSIYPSIVIAALITGAAAFYIYRGDGEPQSAASAISAPQASTSEHPPVSGNTREYRSATHHFSLQYPKDLAVKEFEEGGSAMTVIFENVEKGEGFQIFIIPYNESQVSEERFRQDIPSGIRKGLTDVTIDNAVGAAFYSEHEILGETREFWFIKNGWLYEITAPKSLDAWLSKIVATLEFK